jgi:hypothetical protein
MEEIFLLTDMCLLMDFFRDRPRRDNPNVIATPAELLTDEGCCAWMEPSSAITYEWFLANKNREGKVTFEFCGINVTCWAASSG